MLGGGVVAVAAFCNQTRATAGVFPGWNKTAPT
jgi:hypothetical protein